eukprot:13886-Eustigmatos_ZCMA.PRE.1
MVKERACAAKDCCTKRVCKDGCVFVGTCGHALKRVGDVGYHYTGHEDKANNRCDICGAYVRITFRW